MARLVIEISQDLKQRIRKTVADKPDQTINSVVTPVLEKAFPIKEEKKK